MAATPLATRGARPPAALLEPLQRGPAAKLVAVGQERLAIIMPAIRRMDEEGLSAFTASQWLFSQRGGKPSRATLQRWIEAYHASRDVDSLVPGYKGRIRLVLGWEVRAWQLYNLATKPYRTTVAQWLQEEGFDTATSERVDRFLKSLPKNLTEASVARNGKKHHANTIAPHKVRDYEDLRPGEEWVSDGHKLKLFCRNPATGDIYRLEITPVLDVKTNYLIAWWWSKAESAETTVYAFCSALRATQRVPVWFYTDNGSGFIAQRVQGLLRELSIRHIRGIPGNSKGRGFGEGFHRIVTQRFSKRPLFADVFCGADRSDDALERIRSKAERGLVRVPTDVEVMEEFRIWAQHYNQRPQPYGKLKGKAPADFLGEWAGQPLNTPPERLLLPYADREPTVRRGMLRFERRIYSAGFLAQFHGEKVKLRHDRYDERVVWVFDLQERYVGEAQLIDKAPNVQASIAEDDRERSRIAANRRLQDRIDRNNDNYRPVLSAAATLDALTYDTPPVQLPSRANQILEQGHALIVPQAPKPVRAPRQIDHAEMAAVQAALDAEAARPTAETPEQRFTRYLHLRAAERRGAIPADDARWLAAYAQSAECLGFCDTFDAFGYVPGVTPPEEI